MGVPPAATSAQRGKNPQGIVAAGHGGGPHPMVRADYASRTSSELMKRRLSRIQTAVAEMTGIMRYPN